jgi:Fe-S protein assembly chaperone HscA
MTKISINLKKGEINKPNTIIGIDLGTTNSLVAICDADGLPQTLNGANIHDSPPHSVEHDSPIVPSVIYFPEQGPPIIGQQALPFLSTHPEKTLYSIKRLMGRSFEDIQSTGFSFSYPLVNPSDKDELVKVRIGDTLYNPVELSSLILKTLKQHAESSLDTNVSQAVITVPAYFNDAQRQATRDAGKLAGLDVMRIINEPTAASLAYGIGLKKDEAKTIAVYDLGGGTFDLSILHIHQGIFEVLSTHGHTQLGGDDFDQAIVNHWIQAHQSLQKVSESRVFKQLRLLAEEAKKHLTHHHSYSGSVVLPSGEQIPLMLDLPTFNQCIHQLVAQTLISCQLALKDAELTKEDIDEVVMVGGSTRVPLVRQQVQEFFSSSQMRSDLNPEEVVALGAAVEADILAGNRKDTYLLDVTPLSLGIETMGGIMDFLIHRNSKIPCRAGRQYTTSQDGQTGLIIQVFQGERELVLHNRKLASFELKGIPPMPAGLAKIQITFLLDADGILTVEAEELRSGVKQEIRIQPAYGLTDAEVEHMLLDSFHHAQQDMESRMLIEALTEAKQIIDLTENFIHKNHDRITEEERRSTHEKIAHLKKLLENPEKNAILAGIESLNEISKPYAHRIMDQAISASLKGQSLDNI